MILGSHNSFTYLPPSRWWMWATAPWSRCQSKSLAEQIKAGVRFFDVRCKWNDRQGTFVVAHGLYVTDESVENILNVLNGYGLDRVIHFRLILEYNRDPKSTDIEKEFCNLVMRCRQGRCPNLHFHSAVLKWSWQYIYASKPLTPLCDWYCSAREPKWRQLFITPWLWTKLHSDKPKDTKGRILLKDFV